MHFCKPDAGIHALISLIYSWLARMQLLNQLVPGLFIFVVYYLSIVLPFLYSYLQIIIFNPLSSTMIHSVNYNFASEIASDYYQAAESSVSWCTQNQFNKSLLLQKSHIQSILITFHFYIMSLWFPLYSNIVPTCISAEVTIGLMANWYRATMSKQ